MDTQDIFFNQFKENNNYKYKAYLQKIETVYGIFKEFYGEEYVDLQGIFSEEVYLEKIWNFSKEHDTINDDEYIFSKYLFKNEICAYIYVYWPEVKIQNELGQSHIIKDLYAEISVTEKGTSGYFRLNRSTYTSVEVESDYMHSHVCGIPSDPSVFMDCCLGGGPIKNTIQSLKEDYNENLWKLFCFELNLYVQTESEQGIPYRYISRIGSINDSLQYCIRFNTFNNTYLNMSVLPQDSLDFKQLNLITRFIKYLAKEQPKYIAPAFLSTKNGIDLNFKARYDIINISNDFITFINKQKPADIALARLMMEEVFLNTTKTCFVYKNQNDSFSENENKLIFTFKKKPVYLKIEQVNITKPFNILKVMFIHYILYFFRHAYNCPLNFNSYGREENNIVGKKCTIF